MKQTLLAGLPAISVTLSDAQVQTLCAFGTALLEKNQVMNLTAIRDEAGVARLHFLDSLALLGAADFRNKTVIDVGCGAGFPGVPLKIGEPSVKLTLLDSLGKRMAWLAELLPQLGVDAEVVNARAEDYCKEHRESFELCTSRAVARLNVLAELCLPLVKVGGLFLAMKGSQAEDELREASHAIKTLGGALEQVCPYPCGDATHYVVCIRKLHPTPAAYPRTFAKIKQKPL